MSTQLKKNTYSVTYILEKIFKLINKNVVQINTGNP